MRFRYRTRDDAAFAAMQAINESAGQWIGPGGKEMGAFIIQNADGSFSFTPAFNGKEHDLDGTIRASSRLLALVGAGKRVVGAVHTHGNWIDPVLSGEGMPGGTLPDQDAGDIAFGRWGAAKGGTGSFAVYVLTTGRKVGAAYMNVSDDPSSLDFGANLGDLHSRNPLPIVTKDWANSWAGRGRGSSTSSTSTGGPSRETRSSNDEGRDRGSRPVRPNSPPEGEGGSSSSGSSGGSTPSGDGNYSVYFDVDGSKVTQSPDGGRVIEHPDGSKEVVNPGQLSARERAEQEQKQKEKKEKDEKEKPPEKKEEPKKDKNSDDDDDDDNDDAGGNTTRTDPDSPGASEGSPRRISLPIVPSLADKFSRAMADLARSGGSWGSPLGPTDGPSWGLGRAVGYGDPGSSSGGTSNGGGGDYFGGVQGGMGGSTLRPRPTPIERIRAGLDFGHLNNLPGDPPPVDLRTARMHTVDDDGAAGSVNSSAHQMYLQRVAPIARFSRKAARR